MIISILAAAWWVSALAFFFLSVVTVLLQPLIQRLRVPRQDQPPVSVILPVKLVNPGFERAQASVFAQDYPSYEVLVSAAETDSSALALMRGLVDRAGVSARILHSHETAAVSPKLNTMIPAIMAARHDFLLTKDSNITFAPDTIANLMGSFGPGVGLVCVVPVALRPKTLAGVIEANLINRDARLLLTVSAFGKGFGVGKAMLFRRSDLERAGGVRALSHTIAEDSALQKRMDAIGLKTVFAGVPVDQEIGARLLRDVYERQARWAAIRRKEAPFSFPVEPVACALPAALAGALAAPLIGLSAFDGFGLTIAGFYLVEFAVSVCKRWTLSPWVPVAFLGRDLILMAAWAAAWTTREVIWAGQRKVVHAPRERKVFKFSRRRKA
ncbi:MAG: glycosyltransferase [Beijerinckiaceae bacterium]|nr:glycosyltransferase [Beijerinckiaceae bacterium]